jgi:hypothetical protein
MQIALLMVIIFPQGLLLGKQGLQASGSHGGITHQLQGKEVIASCDAVCPLQVQQPGEVQL